MKKSAFYLSILFLTGCFSEGFNTTDLVAVPSAPPCNPGFCTTTATGNKLADEWVPFEFDFAPIVAGTTFYLENAPSWVTLNTAATKLTGTPTNMATHTGVKIHIYDGTNTEIIGPFNITVSGDPLSPYAWHLANVAQSNFSTTRGIAGEDIEVKPVVAQSITGAGVEILVSDSGVELAHEDLAANILAGQSRNYNLASPYIGDSTPTDPDDGHGTSVAGLIAAVGWNNLGTRGVAPSASIAGTNLLATGVVQSLAVNIDQASGDFDIYNYSYGYNTCLYNSLDSTLLAQLRTGVTTQRGGLGSVYVTAAGNEYLSDLSDCLGGATLGLPYLGNSNFDEEKAHPYMVVVAALNASGSRASYSSPGSNIWVSAPGGEFGDTAPAMMSIDLTGCTMGLSRSTSTENTFENGDALNPTCNYTSTMNGTSSASPITSGVVALMLEANPALTWRDVKHILATTAEVVNSSAGNTLHPLGLTLSGHTYQYGWVQNAAGIKFHNWYGFGRVNANNAVTAALAYGATLPTFVETESPYDNSWYYNSGAVNLAIPDRSATGVSSSISVKHNLNIEAVQVKLNITHDMITDLGLELRSPMGTKSKLMNINNGVLDIDMLDAVLLSNAFYNESSRGNWTLTVVDGANADVGTLDDWSIKIFGHVDPTPAETVAPSPAVSITVPATFASLTATPTVTWGASIATDVMRYEFSVGTTGGDDDVVPWQAVGTALTASENGLVLIDGQTYHFNVRVIDTSENISTVVSDSWVADI